MVSSHDLPRNLTIPDLLKQVHSWKPLWTSGTFWPSAPLCSSSCPWNSDSKSQGHPHIGMNLLQFLETEKFSGGHLTFWQIWKSLQLQFLSIQVLLPSSFFFVWGPASGTLPAYTAYAKSRLWRGVTNGKVHYHERHTTVVNDCSLVSLFTSLLIIIHLFWGLCSLRMHNKSGAASKASRVVWRLCHVVSIAVWHRAMQFAVLRWCQILNVTAVKHRLRQPRS